MIRLLLCLLLFCQWASASNIWYVSTTGTPTGTGGSGSPFDFQTALNKVGVILPGDLVWMRGGVYAHAPQNSIPGTQEGYIFQSTVSGNPSGQITFRSYPGELARVDGGAFGGVAYGFHACARPTLTVGNSASPSSYGYLTFQDIEFFSSSTEARLSGDDSSFPTSITRSDGVNIFGTGVKFINCQVHDLGTGISSWRQSQANELYGNVVWNNGWQGTPNKHGHSFYTQHSVNASGLAAIKRNISMGPYDWGIQAYGSSSTEVSKYRISENIFIGNQVAHGGIIMGTRPGGLADRLTDNQITGNFGYGADLAFYFSQPDMNSYRDLLGANNYFYKAFWELSSWKVGTFTNNWIISPALSKVVDLYPNMPGATIPPWTLNRNVYVVSSVGAQVFGVETEAPRSFAQWQTRTGFDANSTVSASLPSETNYTIVQNNTYDTNRAHVACYNWSLANFAAIDVAALSWGIGSTVMVRNAQNYFTDITTTQITPTNTIVVDMRAASHSVAIPYGDTVPTAPLTFPDFGAFVLQKVSSTNVPPPVITWTTTISSINPASGVTITVSPTDANGAGTGSTSFSRTNLDGTISTLTAPASAAGNSFLQWTRNGVFYSGSMAISYTNSANVSFAVAYATPPPPSTNYTVTVSSVNPHSGVNIVSSPNDNGGLGTGSTTFFRTNIQNRVTTLTAPATASGNTFDHWERNGITYSTSVGITFTNVSNVSFTAFYLTPPPPTATVILTVNSSNPSTGVYIQMAGPDNNGASNGTTPFTRQVLSSTITMLTAPLRSAPGTTFQKWQRNGVDYENNLSTTFTNNAATAMTAIYLSLGPVPSTKQQQISYRRGPRN